VETLKSLYTSYREPLTNIQGGGERDIRMSLASRATARSTRQAPHNRAPQSSRQCTRKQTPSSGQCAATFARSGLSPIDLEARLSVLERARAPPALVTWSRMHWSAQVCGGRHGWPGKGAVPNVRGTTKFSTKNTKNILSYFLSR
jgi:hypothetical protein